jgi:hypothetical protein
MQRCALVTLAPVLAFAFVLVFATACTDATGAVHGGEALTSTTPATCGTTWTSLYADFFGPTGQASCSPSGQQSCHGNASQLGAQTSGFVCGPTKDDCLLGMTQGIPPDAGGFFPPILPPDGGDPTQSQLYVSIHKGAAGPGLNNMPCGNPPTCKSTSATYTFTTSDLACITTWAQQGAPND